MLPKQKVNKIYFDFFNWKTTITMVKTYKSLPWSLSNSNGIDISKKKLRQLINDTEKKINQSIYFDTITVVTDVKKKFIIEVQT